MINEQRERNVRDTKLKENIKSKLIPGLGFFSPLTLAQGPEHSLLMPFLEGATIGHEDKPQDRQREGAAVLHGNMHLLKRK